MKIKILSISMLFLLGITTISYACGGCCGGGATKTPAAETAEAAEKK